MSGNWNDFNDAEEQRSYEAIPKGTIAPVRMTIKPGGYDDPAQGWTGAYATRKETTGAVYLNAEFVILEGPHARRRVWSLIGLLSLKGPAWGNMGRSLVRGILNSACGLSSKDTSPQAQAVRRIDGLHVLDGIEFLARIDVGKDENDNLKNEIRFRRHTEPQGLANFPRSGRSVASWRRAGQHSPTERAPWRHGRATGAGSQCPAADVRARRTAAGRAPTGQPEPSRPGRSRRPGRCCFAPARRLSSIAACARSKSTAIRLGWLQPAVARL